jgi:hypothetical protein
MRSEGRVFSLEFIDVSLRLMRETVFPALRSRFVNALELVSGLSTDLETKLYLSSYLHELAHMRPPFSFVPVANPKLKLKVGDSAIWGEYFADTSMAFAAPNSDLFDLVLFTKIFWYLERHLEREAYASEGIVDNDAFEGLILLEQALSSGLFEVRGDRFVYREARKAEFRASVSLLRENFEKNFEDLGAQEQGSLSEAVKALFVDRRGGAYFARGSTVDLLQKGMSSCAIS